MIPLKVLIDPAQLNGLKILKDRAGTPVNESIRRAITTYLESQGVSVLPPNREDLPGQATLFSEES